MKCDIEYAGKWNDEEVYYCKIHRFKASKNGSKLDECLHPSKEIFDKGLKIDKSDIKKIELVYPNLIDSPKGELFINDEKISGVIYIDESIYEIRDFGGIMLSRLNDITLEVERCTYCNHIHSDDGMFAYTPHNPHLCAYCGHFFNVSKPNVGNELDTILNIPEIELNDKLVIINDKVNLRYDVLNGQISINDENCNRLIIDDNEVSLQEYLNDRLHDEY